MSSQLGSIRECSKDTNIIVDNKEYQLYKGDRILITSMNMMKEDIFPNANEFNGKRFIKQKYAVVNGKKCFNSINSFGGGSHLCPGRFFGKVEMKLTLIHLLQNFEMKLVENTKLIPDRSMGGMLLPKNSVYFEYKTK